jgi:hypothetical protein
VLLLFINNANVNKFNKPCKYFIKLLIIFYAMKRQITITERVKFLIRHIISLGIAKNQEELGQKLGINNKSYISQLVNGRIPNEQFIESLINYTPDFNKDWLYNEDIESPFLDGSEKKITENTQAPEDKIAELEQTIELLKKDVRYYADMADSRLQTIEVQSKLITALEKK